MRHPRVSPISKADPLSTVKPSRKICWQCPENHNHAWRAIVSSRTPPRSRGCPYCYGNRVDEDDSLAVVAPHLADEWDSERNDKKPSLSSALVSASESPVNGSALVSWFGTPELGR
ncbi:hypothetical protein GWP57_14405 [Gammaproteobacteria bacterium]|nr:hypothetical protein [Gammaproteobacteria bacterium]